MTTSTPQIFPATLPRLSISGLDALRGYSERTTALREQLSEAFGPLSRTAEQLRAVGSALSEQASALARDGRSAELIALTHDARRLMLGNSELAVRTAKVLTAYRKNGLTTGADLAALAIRGDADALESVQSLAEYRDPLACEVLAIVRALGALTLAAADLAERTADLVAHYVTADLIKAAATSDLVLIPLPRYVLAGSVDRCAP